MTASVSFVIPALNAEATLGACLDAILAARAGGVRPEILLIDNGSVDGTSDIARARGARVVLGPGLTVAGLRNLGARLAKGEVVAFVDADCVITPDWLEHALPHFDDPSVAVVGAPTHVPPEATWVQRTWALHRHRKNRPGPVSWLATENFLVRKTALFQVGGFNERLVTCEDVDVCYRLAAAFTILNDPELRAIHLGEAPTLVQFFRKEAWRGAGNLSGFLAHRLSASELPSVLWPVYHAAALAGCVMAAGVGWFYRAWWPLALAAGLFCGPAMVAALATARQVRRLEAFPRLCLLYATYAVARAAGLFWTPRRRAASGASGMTRPVHGDVEGTAPLPLWPRESSDSSPSGSR